MDSSLETKPENNDTENVSVVKEQAVEGQTCGSDTLPKEMEKSQKITSDSSCKIDIDINEAGGGKIKHGGGSESVDVVMAEEVENSGAESSQHIDKSGDSPEDADNSPDSKSELVVLDEVEESLDGKEDNDNTTSSKEVSVDAKTSPDAQGENSNAKDNQKNNTDDPYAYVKREDFTSEKYKIEIRGLPRFYGYGELKKFLNDKLKLSSHKMKPTRNKSPWVFVCFKNEEDRQAALKTLNRLPWKGKMLTAMTARPAPDPLVKKRKLESEAGLNQPGKKPRISDDEKLRNSTTPYWNLSYDEQLKKKYDYVMKIMCKLADQIMSVNPMLVPWIKRQKAKYRGMACNLLDIRKSPTCDGYRNKCEFTIGINEETKQRMVGFRLGSYVQGHVGVGPIDSLKHIPQRMKETVKVFEKFIKESDREPFNPETHTGHWRQLTLRLTTLGELMAVVLVNSKGATAEQLELAKKEVKAFFEDGEGKNLKVNSLYFQAFGKREAGKEPPKMEHLLGAEYISESILGLKFRISPEAFFQVNTPGAGILYSTVGEMIDLNPSTTIVDVCCGTGTIGLSLAKDCGQVLGLEVVAPAIEDAKVNAVENNITNSEFFTGRAEEILTSVLSRAKGKSVHAIVDPPRSGLQQKAIVSLRGAEVIDKIIYVSCDPNAALKNFVDLARQTSKAYHGYPLIPVTAIPVDMFPHTAHCEVVMLFHRINPLNLPKIIPGKEDIAILSETLKKSPQKPLQPPDSEKKEERATENDSTEISSNETNKDNKYSENVTINDQKESTVSSEQQSGDKQRSRRKRPGRNQRILARSLLGLVPNKGQFLPPFMPGPKLSPVNIGSSPTAVNKATTPDKFKAKNKIFAPGKIGKFVPRSTFKNIMPGNEDHLFHNAKPNAKFIIKKNLNPKLGDPGNRKRWRKNDELSLRDDDILHDEEIWEFCEFDGEDVVSEGLRPRESYPRRGAWKDQEGQHRDMRGRFPPPANCREGTARRNGGEDHDENVWLRLEQGIQSWIEERERNSESPARKLLRGDDQPLEDGGRYSPRGSNFREEWRLNDDVGSIERESRLYGKGFRDRKEEVRFGRMRPERSPIREPDAWGKRRRRESLSPARRYEGDEFRGRMESERWGHGSDDVKREDVEEEFTYRRRKYSGEECDRPNISDLGERHSRRSCERFNRRSPEMLKRRSSDRFDRRFCERFERRSVERFDRRSSERFDRRPERLSRSPCERCNRRSSERVCRPQQHNFVNDSYHESREDSVRQPADDFIGSRQNRVLQERETVLPKYPQQMDGLHCTEQYNEPKTQLSVSYRENRNIGSSNEREYLPASPSPRQKVGIIGSVELHRKNEVYVYRGPNDASLPLPLDLERRIPISHPEKRYELNIRHRNYDGEDPVGQSDHSVITRRVEVIKRPFMVDEKYGMLRDTSGKSMGTEEMLMVTAKNQMYDGDHRSQFNANEGSSSTRILEHREMSVMRKPDGPHPPTYLKSASPVNTFDNHPEIHSGKPVDNRPQGNWAFERGQMEIPRQWSGMERPNPIRDQPIIPDANTSNFNFCRQDMNGRHQNIPSPAKHSGAVPNVRHNMEKPFSYPTPQTGYGPKVYTQPNCQVPPNVASHLDFSNKIGEHSNRSQNGPFNSMPSNSRMNVPYNHPNSSSMRPNMFPQNPTFMGSGMQGNQPMPSLATKQPLTMSGPILDISNRQRMPSPVPSSAPDSKINSWSFKGINPWSEGNQQMMHHQKQW